MKNQFKINIKLDFWTIGIALLLSIIGIIFIYSASYIPPKSVQSYNIIASKVPENTKYLKQILFLAVCLVVYLVISNISYERYKSQYVIVYGVGILLLLFTLIFGSTINNSKSWIRLGFANVQLAEFCKITFLIFYAVLLNNNRNLLKKFMIIPIIFLFLVPYLGFIMLQPDFGTSLIFILMFFIISYIGGVNSLYLSVIAGIGFIAVIIPFATHYVVEVLSIDKAVVNVLHNTKYLAFVGGIFLLISGMNFFAYKNFFSSSSKKLLVSFLIFLTLGFGVLSSIAVKKVLKNHHYERFLVFIDSSVDLKGKAYNIIQSKISIGSGGFTGRGLTQGKQNQGKFLPAKDTDFIIALIAEEWGFLGISLILLLFLLLIYRCLYIVYSARDYVGSLIALGITSMYVSHITINILSVVGYFPVVGIPLPFLSYGGSSLLTNFVALGILFNIKMKRFSYS